MASQADRNMTLQMVVGDSARWTELLCMVFVSPNIYGPGIKLYFTNSESHNRVHKPGLGK